RSRRPRGAAAPARRRARRGARARRRRAQRQRQLRSGPRGGRVNVILSPEEKNRLRRIDALAALGPPAITRLVALLAERSWAVRRAVIAALASLGEAAVKPLFDVVRGRRDDETALAAAVDALAASTSADADHEALAATKEDRPTVVADAVQILGR